MNTKEQKDLFDLTEHGEKIVSRLAVILEMEEIKVLESALYLLETLVREELKSGELKINGTIKLKLLPSNNEI